MWLLILALLLISAISHAEYVKGFNEGPYIRLTGGYINSTFDNNARTGAKVGGNYEPAFGLQFGWFLWDQMGPELAMRYSTKKTGDNREHILIINVNAKYSFITSALTGINGDFHIMPFVQGGPCALLAAVPADPLSGKNIMGVYGGGFGGAAGIDFLIKQYIYFSAMFQADAYYIPAVKQNIAGTNQTIISGGWEPIYGAMGTVGVHF